MPKPPVRQVPTKKCTRGPLQAVPCPHCGRNLDFRPLAPSRAGGAAGEGDYGCEVGAVIGCDFCKRYCLIKQVQTVTVVYLQQHWRPTP